MNATNETDHDEAMEWITDWDYERILGPYQQQQQQQQQQQRQHQHRAEEQGGGDDDDASMDVMDDPLPLDHPAADPHHDSSSQEIAIFWTRVTEELTDDDLNGMFGDANAHHPLVSSRRNSRNSLGFFMETEGVVPVEEETAAETARVVSSSEPPVISDEDQEEVDSYMGPMQEKEGLLPPMSPSQLYHQGNAQYGMIPSHQSSSSASEDRMKSDSTGTHTTVDLMEDETEEEDDREDYDAAVVAADYVGSSSSSPDTNLHHTNRSNPNNSSGSDAIFERQQKLRQKVLQQAPSSAARRSSAYHELPRPSDHQQRLLQEMKDTNKKQQRQSSASSSSSPHKQDPIFARQQEIFQQMRGQQEQEQQEQRAAKEQQSHRHPHYSSYHHHHLHHSHSSPVSVTKTLTRAGMDSDEYHKVVTRLTEKNLIERQRALLQESMKRSLESRQALHIKPTALPDYNHDKLSRVLKDIESSSRNISETYGRR